MDKHNFKIPENYFNELKDNILNETVNNKTNHFKVPDSYFKELEESILKETVNKKQKSKIIWLKPLSIAGSVAASLLLLFFVFNPFNSNERKTFSYEELLYQQFIQEDFQDDSIALEEDSFLEEYAFLLETPNHVQSNINKIESNSKEEIINNDSNTEDHSNQDSDELYNEIYDLYFEEDYEFEDDEIEDYDII